ncbi:PREDICTED: uncharacterized protein LOC108550042 [Eufriesea mexicana]|uniref:uncharacterized protein LOC108550042 n=1 Tax=Eufriesea mexicana TaxID=516756 RepID=UPI00083BF318|nr:PREDICTED: uncharacterized protein LOC108550042 [Eufriesea mexicana]
MDFFENHYRLYALMLRMLGLWPYSVSIYSTIKRMLLSTAFLNGVLIQIVLLIKTEITLENFTRTLSITLPILLFFCRYVSSVLNFEVTRYLIDQIDREYTILESSTEMQILTKYIDESSQIITIFAFPMMYLLMPTALDFAIPLNESRTRYISYVNLYFIDHSEYADVAVLYFSFIFLAGLCSVICTESLLNVCSHYISGLLKITSYRLRNAVTNLSICKSTYMSNLIEDYSDFHRVVDIHNRAIEYINLAASTHVIQYSIASIIGVISFAFSLYRLFRAIHAMNDKLEICISIDIFVVHLLILFLNNYYGQLVINNSLDVFHESYNSTWHCIPLKAQKLLLFIMFRSSVECAFDLSGLYVPCYTGFSAMMSTSFSYFSLMYSIQ